MLLTKLTRWKTASEALEAARKIVPVCCYCDAPLSCARCGCEQPADDVSILKSRVEELEACTALATFNEACKRIEELEAALREIAGRSWHPANVRLGDIARAALAPEQDK